MRQVSLRVSEGKSVLLGGLARLHMREGLPFILSFYLANAVSIHPTDTAKVEAVLERHTGGLLSPPSSLERLREWGPFAEQSFTVHGRGWDESAVRTAPALTPALPHSSARGFS